MVLHQDGSSSFMKLVQYKVIPGYNHVGEKKCFHTNEHPPTATFSWKQHISQVSLCDFLSCDRDVSPNKYSPVQIQQ